MNPCIIELVSLTISLPSLTGARRNTEEAQFDLVDAVASREQRGRAHVAVVGTVAMAWRRRDAPHRAPHLSLTSLPPLTPAPQPAGHRSRRPRTVSVHAPCRPNAHRARPGRPPPRASVARRHALPSAPLHIYTVAAPTTSPRPHGRAIATLAPLLPPLHPVHDTPELGYKKSRPELQFPSTPPQRHSPPLHHL